VKGILLLLLLSAAAWAGDGSVIDDFERGAPWKISTTHGARATMRLVELKEGNRVLQLRMTVPPGAERGGRVYLTLPLNGRDFSAYDAVQLQVMYDKPNLVTLSLLLQEATGSWYRAEPFLKTGDAENWHRYRALFSRMKWFFERKSDENSKLDLDALSALQLFFSCPAGTNVTFYIDDITLWKRPSEPRENLIRMRTGKEAQIFFLPEPIVIEAWLLKPRTKGKIRWRFEARDIEGRVVARREIQTDSGSEHVKFEFKGVGYFDVVARVSDDTGVLRERKFSVGAVKPLSEADDAVVQDSPFGIWVAGGNLLERLGIRWKRIYCQPWDFEPVDDGYRWIAEKRTPFFRGIRKRFPKTEFICYFRGMPRWLTSRPDRTDYHKFPPADWEAYARFIRYYVRNAKDRIKIWEVWNEPVPYAYWMGTIEEVVKLHEVTYRAVHAEQRDAVVIGPCPYTFKWDFLERFFELGGARWIDAVSIHTYRPRGGGPEATDYERDLRRLREMLSRYPHLKDIYITELGWSTQRVGELTQADYLVRSLVQSIAGGIKVVIWHMYWDWNDVELVGGHGILRHDGTPKPALVAYAVLARNLLRARFLGKVGGLSGKALGYRFEKDGRRIWVLWDWGEKPSRAELNVGAQRAELEDMFGRRQSVEVSGGVVKLELGAHPVYLHLD